MTITEIDHGLDLNAPTEGYVRTEGLHMSNLYNSLYEHIQPERYAKKDDDSGPHEGKMSLGTAFEENLAIQFAKRLFASHEHIDRPGEFCTQHAESCPRRKVWVEVGDAPCYCGAGVIFSPDGLIYNGITRLAEFKCSWYSIRHGIRDERFDKWFCQMKVYCYHLRLEYARLYAFFVMGDYSFKGDVGAATLKTYDIQFKPIELADEWQALVRHGRKVGLLPEAA